MSIWMLRSLSFLICSIRVGLRRSVARLLPMSFSMASFMLWVVITLRIDVDVLPHSVIACVFNLWKRLLMSRKFPGQVYLPSVRAVRRSSEAPWVRNMSNSEQRKAISLSIKSAERVVRAPVSSFLILSRMGGRYIEQELIR